MPVNANTIPSDAPKSASTFTILSGGAVVSQAYQVLSIVVNKEINRIPKATIVIADGNAAAQTFSISSAPDFEPGKAIEIKLGYRVDEQTVFVGVVVKHSIKVRNQTSVLVIECRDVAFKMTIAPKSKYFKDMTDSDVMEALINGHGVDNDVLTTSPTLEELVQYNTTDWDFMLCRTDANGLLCVPNDGKITIAKPDFAADAVLNIDYGSTIYDLDAEIDARFQFSGITATGWSPADAALLSEEAGDAGVPDAGNLPASALGEIGGEAMYNLQHTGNLKSGELQQWADAMMLKHRLAKIRGKVTTDGTAAVSPGQMIQLNGVGDRFAGKLFVTGVRQQLEDGVWQTVFQFGLNPEWFVETYKVEEPLAGALLPAVQGLQVGIVTKLENDPEGQNRIMVRLPVIHPQDEGIWSRVATLDAGKDRGTFMLPELDDEVIVGFLNNDPRHAVILGMVNSSNKPAPLTASDANNEKGYVSRSKMKMIFNDDKKSVTIETPAGNKIVLTEEDSAVTIEDQNGSKMTLDSAGCTVSSSKDIVLDAPMGNVTVNGIGGNSIKIDSSGITLAATGKLTLQGGQIELSGGAVAVNAGMAQFSGVLQATTVIAPTIVGSSYTPGAGNLW